jgi:ribose 5-phosphate isomerase B
MVNEMNLTDTTIGLASDHAGFEYTKLIKNHLRERGLSYMDFGAASTAGCDYTDYAHLLGEALGKGEITTGIALCGTGNGMAITLNKYPAARAGLAWNVDVARLISRHNDANILVIPARFVTQEEVTLIVDAWLDTPFEGGRHLERIRKIVPPAV